MKYTYYSTKYLKVLNIIQNFKILKKQATY